MRVEVSKGKSSNPDSVRITGCITSNEGKRDVWFELPQDLESDLTLSGNPWLLVMLPAAIKTGESIELSLPVDPLFLENIRLLVEIWRSWYPEVKQVGIQCPTQRAAIGGKRVGQFFSGGVDSWFTLLRHTESTSRFPQVGDVDDLITVWGLDIPIANCDEFDHLSKSVRAVAETYGKRQILMATNLRENLQGTWKSAWGPGWGSLSHAAGLAIAALLVERRYSQIKIGSTGLGTLPPWGSHPMTDALFSTSATAFLHDHALYNRADKIERIGESDYALSKLKVCYAEGTFRNCSRCSKCHRTLLSLDALGLLDKAVSFDVAIYRKNRNRYVLVWSENDHAMVEGVRDLAIRHGRPDIAALMEESIKRSRVIKAFTEPLKQVSWRLWNSAYRRLTANMIGA